MPRAAAGTNSRVTTSPGASTLLCMPSPTKKSSTASVRRPAAPAISTSADSEISAGATSDEWAATQRRPCGTTWHTVPLFLRQKPTASRQNSVWL